MWVNPFNEDADMVKFPVSPCKTEDIDSMADAELTVEPSLAMLVAAKKEVKLSTPRGARLEAMIGISDSMARGTISTENDE
jgi:hypothetical protein